MKNILASIFAVALSESEGNDIQTGKMTPCEIEKQKLKKLISGVNDENDLLNKVLDECVSNEKKEDEQFFDNFEDSSLHGFEDFAKSLEKDCTESIQGFEGDHDNHQYLPSLVKTIVKFMKFLPLWSGIMIPEFKFGSTTASSTPVESNFNNIKNRVFKHVTLPIRCDDFLKIHIKSLEGFIKCAAASVRAH